MEDALRVKNVLIERYWAPVAQLAMEVAPSLLSLAANITGVGVGPRIRKGEVIPDDWCVRVYVVKKLPIPLLGNLVLPTVLDGVPIDVIPSGRFRQLAGVGAVSSAVTVGTGIELEGSPRMGTLAVFLKDANQHVYLASCRHVLEGPPGKAVHVLTPSGTLAATIANLSQIAKLTLSTAADAPPQADCAIAELAPGIHPAGLMPFGLPALAPSPVSLAKDDVVVRAGTTQSPGVVFDASATIQVNLVPTGTYYFPNQVLIQHTDPTKAFAVPGDSGSLVVRTDGSNSFAAGMVFAAASQAVGVEGQPRNLAAMCPMQMIFDALKPLTLKLLT
jgi:hypothetical protein